MDTRVQLLLTVDGVTLEIGLPAQCLVEVEPRLELDPATTLLPLTMELNVWGRTPNLNLATQMDVQLMVDGVTLEIGLPAQNLVVVEPGLEPDRATTLLPLTVELTV